MKRNPPPRALNFLPHAPQGAFDAVPTRRSLPTSRPTRPFDGDLRKPWREWITRGWFEGESEGFSWWGNLQHAASYWPYRHLEKVLFLRSSDLEADPAGEVRRSAGFLELELSAAELASVVAESHVDRMCERALENDALLGMIFDGGARRFFFKGTNGRWRDVLDADVLARYEAAKQRVLEPACAE